MVVIKNSESKLGFGLIELLVSLSIMMIVTGIVLARHNSFNSAILLRNQAYEIAFVIREAQQLAVSGAQSDLSVTGQKQRYGVSFSTSATGEVNSQAVLLYQDKNNNGNYNSGTDALLKTVRLDSRFNISGLSLANAPQGDVRVVFERPFFDAKFYQANADTLISGPAEIVITPVGDVTKERTITVTPSGQITVQ